MGQAKVQVDAMFAECEKIMGASNIHLPDEMIGPLAQMNPQIGDLVRKWCLSCVRDTAAQIGNAGLKAKKGPKLILPD